MLTADTMLLFAAVGGVEELRYFRVGLSNDAPEDTGQSGDYKLCSQWWETPRVIMDLSCDEITRYEDKLARYVTIDVPGDSKQLTLCEVQVFGVLPGRLLSSLLKVKFREKF